MDNSMELKIPPKGNVNISLTKEGNTNYLVAGKYIGGIGGSRGEIIGNIITSTDNYTEPSDNNVYSSLRSRNEFLCKDSNLIQIVNGPVEFGRQVVLDEGFKTKEFSEIGNIIQGAKLDPSGVLTLAKLKAMSFEVYELIYNIIRAQGGKFAFSNSANIEKVEYILKENGKIVSEEEFFSTSGNTIFSIDKVSQAIITIKIEQDTPAVPFRNSDILYAQYTQIGESGEAASGGQSFMKVVSKNNEIGVNGGSSFRVEFFDILDPGETIESEGCRSKVPSNVLPISGTAVAQRGNVNPGENPDRLTSFFIDTTTSNLYMLSNVEYPIPDVTNYGVVLGQLPDELFAKVHKEYEFIKSYDPVIYAKYGIFEKILHFDHLGKPIRSENNRGLWSKETATDSAFNSNLDPTDPRYYLFRYKSLEDYYDVVTWNGELWKCLLNDTTAEPSAETEEGKKGWLKLVAKGSAGIAPFKSLVFKRSEDIPNIPIGGTYDNPIPDGDWSDGIPEGITVDEVIVYPTIWSSYRTFYGDSRDEESNWSKPQKMVDNIDFEVMYSAKEYESATQAKEDIQTNIKITDKIDDAWWVTANKYGWYDDAEELSNPKWMATNKRDSGQKWTDNWSVSLIKGESGKDGITANPNLLPNTNFDLYESNGTNLRYWRLQRGSVIENGYQGNNSYYISEGGELGVLSCDIPITFRKNEVYTLSCIAKNTYSSTANDTTTVTGFVLYIPNEYLKIESYQNVTFSNVGTDTASSRKDIYFGNTPDWEKKVITFRYIGEEELSTAVLTLFRWNSEGEWAQIKLEAGDTATPYQKSFNDFGMSYKSTVFKRSTETPGTPTDGTYDNPIPSGWYDGIPPESSGDIYSSTCTFHYGGGSSGWSTPQKMVDTVGFEVMYSNNGTVPNIPSNFDNSDTWWESAKTNGWHDNESEVANPKWMATNSMVKGAWGNWVVTQILGEKGDSGTNAKQIVLSAPTLFIELTTSSTPNTTTPQTINAYIYDGTKSLALSTATCSAVAGFSVDTTVSGNTAIIKFTPLSGYKIALTNTCTITLTATDGTTLSTTFTINGNKPGNTGNIGPAGEPGDYYSMKGEWEAYLYKFGTMPNGGKSIPVVYYTSSNDIEGNYYALKKEITSSVIDKTPPENTDYWEVVEKMGLVYTKGIMANWATLGSSYGCVFYDRYLFSQIGTDYAGNYAHYLNFKGIMWDDTGLSGQFTPALLIDMYEGSVQLNKLSEIYAEYKYTKEIDGTTLDLLGNEILPNESYNIKYNPSYSFRVLTMPLQFDIPPYTGSDLIEVSSTWEPDGMRFCILNRANYQWARLAQRTINKADSVKFDGIKEAIKGNEYYSTGGCLLLVSDPRYLNPCCYDNSGRRYDENLGSAYNDGDRRGYFVIGGYFTNCILISPGSAVYMRSCITDGKIFWYIENSEDFDIFDCFINYQPLKYISNNNRLVEDTYKSIYPLGYEYGDYSTHKHTFASKKLCEIGNALGLSVTNTTAMCEVNIVGKSYDSSIHLTAPTDTNWTWEQDIYSINIS